MRSMRNVWRKSGALALLLILIVPVLAACGGQPTAAPTTAPAQPTAAPTTAPAAQPTVAPTEAPAAQPTVAPTTPPAAQRGGRLKILYWQ
ncbi:MAG: peptide ABC transporter substrate-binding protein, partial [Roseiflexus sp.]|nr:peptide ABC transporter substrate-binding protein [Roseiflexus sp.]